MEKILIFILIIYLTWISYIDYKTKLIRNKSLIPIVILGILYSIVFKSFIPSLVAFLTGGGILLIFALITGGIEGGDVKLMAVLGLFLGCLPSILTVVLMFLFAAVIAYPVLLVLKKDAKTTPVAMAPFITLAFITSYFCGNKIIYWYLSSIGI